MALRLRHTLHQLDSHLIRVRRSSTSVSAWSRRCWKKRKKMIEKEWYGQKTARSVEPVGVRTEAPLVVAEGRGRSSWASKSEAGLDTTCCCCTSFSLVDCELSTKLGLCRNEVRRTNEAEAHDTDDYHIPPYSSIASTSSHCTAFCANSFHSLAKRPARTTVCTKLLNLGVLAVGRRGSTFC